MGCIHIKETVNQGILSFVNQVLCQLSSSSFLFLFLSIVFSVILTACLNDLFLGHFVIICLLHIYSY